MDMVQINAVLILGYSAPESFITVTVNFIRLIMEIITCNSTPHRAAGDLVAKLELGAGGCWLAICGKKSRGGC